MMKNRIRASVCLLLAAMDSPLMAQDSLRVAMGKLFPAPTALGEWSDTVRIDRLLDSVKVWVANGETERSSTSARLAIEGLDAIAAEPRNGQLAQRQLQAARLEAHHYAGRYAQALSAFAHMQRLAERMGDPRQMAAAIY